MTIDSHILEMSDGWILNNQKGGLAMANDVAICKACDGKGMQSDDEGWQYKCSVCDGKGVNPGPARVLEVDETNRLLD